MAEITKFWMIHSFYGGSHPVEGLFEDKAIKDDEHRLAQFGYEDEGMDIHRLVSIYDGTPKGAWQKEKTKLYDNAADAKKDAEKRLNAARKKYEKMKKSASEVDEFKDALLAQKIASRVAGE